MKKLTACFFSLVLAVAIMVPFVSAAGTDLIRGKIPVLVSNNPGDVSTCPPSSVLTDGNNNWSSGSLSANLWYSANTGKDGATACDVTLTWDMGKESNVVKYTIWSNADWVQNDGWTINSKAFAAKDWTVEISSDNASWKTIDTVTSNLYVRCERPLASPEKGRYIRFHFTKSSEKLDGLSGDFWPALRLSDIQVSDSPASNTSSTANNSKVANSTAQSAATSNKTATSSTQAVNNQSTSTQTANTQTTSNPNDYTSTTLIEPADGSSKANAKFGVNTISLFWYFVSIVISIVIGIIIGGLGTFYLIKKLKK